MPDLAAKKKWLWVVRPILCMASLLVAGSMMLYGLMNLGTADVVPAWFQGLVMGSFGWFFFDRSLNKRLGDKEEQ